MMKSFPKLCLLSVFTFFLFVFAGCGEQRPEGFPKLYPVTLDFAQEGKPLDNAVVRLYSEEVAWVISGRTDSGGRVRFLTHGKYPGVPAGTYKISVVKDHIEPRPGYVLKDEFDTMATDAYALVAPEYESAATTPLTLTVDGKKTESFELGKAVRIKRIGE